MSRLVRPVAPRPQSGQALIWLLGTLATCALLMLAVFSTSQVTVGKQRAVNAADAGALAGAQAQARLLNLVAYSNRAVVANDVFLGQMLSIQSWLMYVQRTADNISDVTSFLKWIPYVGPVFAAIEKVMDAAAKAADKSHSVVKKGTDIVIKALDVARNAIYAGQGAVHAGGALLAVDAARSVVNANKTTFGSRHDPGVQMMEDKALVGVSFALNQKQWNDFTTKYTGDDRTDARQITLDSRDDFTQNRPGKGLFTMSSGFAGFEKQGGSDIKVAGSGGGAGFDRWETQDTLEFWHKLPLAKKRTYMPIGWGRANADDSSEEGSTWAPGRTVHSLARNDNPDLHSGWKGVAELRDVADKSVASRDTLGLDFIVAVTRAGSSDLTSAQLGMGSKVNSPAGSVDLPTNMQDGRHLAFAKARVFFERPRRGLFNDSTASPLWRPDIAKEHGSLYSPYWQARLRDLSVKEKTALMAVVGIWPDALKYTPGAQ
jgi:hypothetical protein